MTMAFQPSTSYQLRAVERSRYSLNYAIDDLTNLLLDIYGENQDWDGDPLDDARSELQQIDEKLIEIAEQLKVQGANVELD